MTARKKRLGLSGLAYEVDMSVGSTCTSNEEGLFTGISGERRVVNVTVGGEPLDPEATYTVAGQDYLLPHNGDGQTAFDGAQNVVTTGKLDSEVMIDHIHETLGGEIGADYSDPYGQGRIVIKQ